MPVLSDSLALLNPIYHALGPISSLLLKKPVTLLWKFLVLSTTVQLNGFFHQKSKTFVFVVPLKTINQLPVTLLLGDAKSLLKTFKHYMTDTRSTKTEAVHVTL